MTKRLVLGLLLVTTVAFSPVAVHAVNLFGDGCNGASGSVCSDIDKNGGNDAVNDAGNIISTIVNALIYIIGALSVIVIVIGGFQLVTSGGGAEQVKRARTMVLYALVGLALLARRHRQKLLTEIRR